MIVSEHGVEFGMGTVWAKDKLTFGSFEALADIIRCAILDRKFTQNDIINELDKHTNLLDLFNEIEGELKNSQAVQTVEAKREALETEENGRKEVKIERASCRERKYTS